MLGCYDVQVVDRAGLVLVLGDVESLFGRFGGFDLGLGFLGQEFQRGQVVFDVLEGGEDGLAVGGYVEIVGGDVLFDLGVDGACVEKGLGQVGAEGPEAVGARKRVENSLDS